MRQLGEVGENGKKSYLICIKDRKRINNIADLKKDIK